MTTSPLTGPGVTIQLHRYHKGKLDAHGNPTTSYAPPQPLQVYGIAPTASTEPDSTGRAFATTSTWDIYAPQGTNISPYDLITLPDGTQTQVLGTPRTWTQTPFLPLLPVGGVQITVQAKQG